VFRSSNPDVSSEVQIMRGTDHPSIVKLYAFSESAEYYYLILECQCSLSLKSISSPLNPLEISDGGWRVVPSNRQADVF